MANSNSPFGLKPVRHLLGLPMNGSVQPMFIPSTYATALFIGDPVLKTANGSNAALVFAPGAGEFQIGTLPEINKCAAGATNRITGVIVAIPAADMGLNANLIFTQSGSTTTGLSGVELNSATQAADATFQLMIQKAV